MNQMTPMIWSPGPIVSAVTRLNQKSQGIKMPRTKYSSLVQPAFILDLNTIVQGYGVQILWDRIGESARTTAFTVTTSAIAAQGATSV
ncbi:hypothetical protein NL375_30355, partial [Klebsiella pneumoniae]|nr:hypothetical protein [Klebsiella pneumoniae]